MVELGRGGGGGGVALLEDGATIQDRESFVSQLLSQFQNCYTPQGHEQAEESGVKEIM